MQSNPTKQSTPALPPAGLLRLRQIIGDRKRGVVGLIPISQSGWYNGIADGRFPRPVSLGPNTVAWRVEDIRALIERGVEPQAAEA